MQNILCWEIFCHRNLFHVMQSELDWYCRSLLYDMNAVAWYYGSLFLNCDTLAHVTYQDIRSISSLDEQTVIAIKAPPETRLEVPDPETNIQIWLKSTKGPIEVYLCPEDTEGNGDTSSSSLGSLNSEESRESLYVSDDSLSCDSFRCKYMYTCMKFNLKKILQLKWKMMKILVWLVFIPCVFTCVFRDLLVFKPL